MVINIGKKVKLDTILFSSKIQESNGKKYIEVYIYIFTYKEGEDRGSIYRDLEIYI